MEATRTHAWLGGHADGKYSKSPALVMMIATREVMVGGLMIELASMRRGM
jgi:hypothetical protein